ncbi:hypothetical protein GCM10009433_14030 [Psychroflexus lacisalsi]|jgi:hypothetical protein|uniref:Transposase DDE domain-containing protein n=1 Tax=Psychroflexus lacisalsi TaxID=503928 RepID=A0ABN1K7T3_9FLAO
MKELAHECPFSFLTMRKERLVDNRTDSIIEHKKDTNRARNRYAKSKNILFFSKLKHIKGFTANFLLS